MPSEPRPAHVEIHVRPGNVGDDQVERRDPLQEPESGGQPVGLVRQRRHGELRDVGEQIGGQRVVLILRRAHRLMHGCQPRGGVRQMGWERRDDGRDAVAVGAFFSSVRIDTGTAVRSGPSGRASCFCSQMRSAPAHNAITTSLTVTPAAFLIALTCASGEAGEGPATMRSEMFLLNGVAGAINGGADRTTPRSRRNTNRSMSGSQGNAGLRQGQAKNTRFPPRTARPEPDWLPATQRCVPGASPRRARFPDATSLVRPRRPAPARCPSARRASRCPTPRRWPRGAPSRRGLAVRPAGRG